MSLLLAPFQDPYAEHQGHHQQHPLWNVPREAPQWEQHSGPCQRYPRTSFCCPRDVDEMPAELAWLWFTCYEALTFVDSPPLQLPSHRWGRNSTACQRDFIFSIFQRLNGQFVSCYKHYPLTESEEKFASSACAAALFLPASTSYS